MPETMTAASRPTTEEARLAQINAKFEAQKAGAEALTMFQVNDVYVFDTTTEDLVYSAAGQAHALCVVLSNAIDNSTDAGTDSMNLRPVHISRAVDAISSLIGLALFAQQAKS